MCGLSIVSSSLLGYRDPARGRPRAPDGSERSMNPKGPLGMSDDTDLRERTKHTAQKLFHSLEGGAEWEP